MEKFAYLQYNLPIKFFEVVQ